MNAKITDVPDIPDLFWMLLNPTLKPLKVKSEMLLN